MTIQQSIDARTKVGMQMVSRAEFERRWDAAGFRFDASCAISDTAHYMTGDYAGESERYIALYPIRKDTGLPAFHVDTPADIRIKVREMRREFFAVSRGCIVEI